MQENIVLKCFKRLLCG